MSRLSRTAACASVVIALGGLPAFAQSVISAHSGLIHYVECRVLLDGKPVEVKITSFPAIKEGTELRTEDGRAEVLLNPSVILRKKGIYRFDSEPAQLRVTSGEAEVEAGGNVLIVRAGKMVAFDGAV